MLLTIQTNEQKEIEKLLSVKIKDKEYLNEITNNIINKDILFPTEKDAINYIKDISQLYDYVIVNYNISIKNFKDTNEEKELQEKINNNIQNYLDFPNKQLEKFKQQKSKTRSCEMCKSIINKDYQLSNIEKEYNIIEEKIQDTEEKITKKLEMLKCPICHTDNFIPINHEKIEKLKENIKISENKYKEAELLFSVKNGFIKSTLIYIKDK